MFIFGVPSSLPMWLRPRNLVIVGFFISITMIGIIVSLILFVMAAVIAVIFTKGTCPHCKNDILYAPLYKAFTCFYCHRRILLQNNRLRVA